MTPVGIDALTDFVAESVRVAEDRGCEDMLGFATSAVRDAVNSEAVLAHVQEQTGVELAVLSGSDEARLTFLAVRRWFGWSAGRLAVFDIGGGSLEIAGGADEAARPVLTGHDTPLRSAGAHRHRAPGWSGPTVHVRRPAKFRTAVPAAGRAGGGPCRTGGPWRPGSEPPVRWSGPDRPRDERVPAYNQLGSQ